MDQRRHPLLIVDDEPDVLESLRHLFHRQYQVLVADSGERALDLIEDHDAHLIMSDQRMPGMGGDAFLTLARIRRPDAVRMLFTGYADIQAVISAVNEGQIFRYILKPWDVTELEGIIRQAAEHYELVAERRRLVDELQAANAQLTQANRELLESVQLKTAFLEVASHEFNTPITLVHGLSELLRLLNPDRDPEERQVVDQLAISSRQLSRLVATTLKQMGENDLRQTLRRQPTDLSALLRGVAEGVMPFARARDIRLRVEVPDGLGPAEVDPDKVRDITANLLTNAIKFTPDGGVVVLEAAPADVDEVEIRVIDCGIGVEPRALEHFFQPFFTEFDPSRHSTGDFGFNQRGLGLGLSLVKKFVDLHGGRARAESTPGQGTRITVRLPLHARPAAVAQVESSVGAAGNGSIVPAPDLARP